jgi:hypothetical protein
MFPVNFFLKFFDRFFCVIGALCFSQIPNYIKQYQNHLAGHVDELHYQIKELEKIAATSHITLQEYIHKFLIQTDQDFYSQGVYLQNLSDRYLKLFKLSLGLEEASFFTKPFYLLAHLDFSIAIQTARDFQSALPLSLEGFCYIIAGIFFGTTLFWVLRRLFNRKKNKTPPIPISQKLKGLSPEQITPL